MVTRLDTAQPLNHNTDAAFPHGAPRNNVSPDDKTGTKWVESWVKDIEALKQNLLISAGITPSGTPDTATVSQLAIAVQNLTLPAAWDAAATGATSLAGLYPWARGARVYLCGGGGGGRSGQANSGGGGGGSGQLRCFDLLDADGFDWTFTVNLLGASGTGGTTPTNGGQAAITLSNGMIFLARGGTGASGAAAGGIGHCGGGGAGYYANAGGSGGSFSSSGTGIGATSDGAGGLSVSDQYAYLFSLGLPVSPQPAGAGGTGTTGNGGGGGGGHLAFWSVGTDGAPGDSGVNSGGKAGWGYGGGGGGGGGTGGAFLGVGGNGGSGLVRLVPF